MYTDFVERERALDALRDGAAHGVERFFTRTELVGWRATGLSWRSIARYGPNIGPEAVLRALEHGVPPAYVDALATAGIDDELAIWWFATGVPADDAIARTAAGPGPHQVRTRARHRITTDAVTEEQP